MTIVNKYNAREQQNSSWKIIAYSQFWQIGRYIYWLGSSFS